jgi:hypothetical protein
MSKVFETLFDKYGGVPVVTEICRDVLCAHHEAVRI